MSCSTAPQACCDTPLCPSCPSIRPWGHLINSKLLPPSPCSANGRQVTQHSLDRRTPPLEPLQLWLSQAVLGQSDLMGTQNPAYTDTYRSISTALVCPAVLRTVALTTEYGSLCMRASPEKLCEAVKGPQQFACFFDMRVKMRVYSDDC